MSIKIHVWLSTNFQILLYHYRTNSTIYYFWYSNQYHIAYLWHNKKAFIKSEERCVYPLFSSFLFFNNPPLNPFIKKAVTCYREIFVEKLYLLQFLQLLFYYFQCWQRQNTYFVLYPPKLFGAGFQNVKSVIIWGFDS